MEPKEIRVQVLLNSNLLQANGLAKFNHITSNSAKQYIIYTLNEKTESNGKELTKVYVSETNEAQGYEFASITQEEWGELKNIMLALGQVDAKIPSNVQLSSLQPTQYTVGPYRKIAINDSIKNNILINQINNEPKENVIMPKGNMNFFDPTLKEDIPANQEVAEESAIPNAFSMAAPVPASMSFTPDTQGQPVQEAPVQAAAPTEQVIPATLVDAPPEVIQALNTFLKYVGADMNKVNHILHIDIVTNDAPTETVIPVEEAVVPVEQAIEMPQQAEGEIDINNLPVVHQEPEVEEHVLEEEPIIPSTPTIPVEDTAVAPALPVETAEPVQESIIQQVVTSVETPAVAEATQPVEQVAAEVQPEAPVAETPQVVEAVAPVESAPVEAVVAQPAEAVAPTEPVAQQSIVEQVMQPTVPVEEPVQQELTVPETIVDQPIQPVELVQQPTELIQPTEPVENTTLVQPITQAIEPVAPVDEVEVPQVMQPVELVQPVESVAPVAEAPADIVQTQVVEPVQTMPPLAPTSETIQNEEVNLTVPTEPVAPVEAASVDMGIPSITPLSQEDIQMVNPVVPEEVPVQDTSFLDAGPVIVPQGQENIASIGLPGDSGAKVLEKVA